MSSDGSPGHKVWPGSLVLAGAGKMGGALLRGWIAQGLTALAITVVDPHLDEVTAQYCHDAGVGREPPGEPPFALVLAVKPQTFATDAASLASLAGPDTLVISIMAGTTLATLRAALPHAGGIVRAMPNMPASVGRGASALVAEAGMSPEHREVAHTLLGAVGHVEWLHEDMIDAITAVSGSGPAYVFLLAEGLAAAGVAAGLPPAVADRVARATVEGAGAMMAGHPELTPAQLRQSVTSRGGTTAAALDVLRAPDGMERLLTAAVAAAKARAAAMADTG